VTQPPDDPTARDTSPDAPPGAAADASPTEPVPVVAVPADRPEFAAPEPGPTFAAPEHAAPPPPFAFSPVEPEPGPGSVRAASPATPASTGPRRDGSRVLSVFLGAAVLVGVVGLAFAAGRASSPATDTANVSSGQDLSRNRGTEEDRGGLGPMQNGGLGGGNLPDASFDLDGKGSGNGRGGDADGDGEHGMPPGGGLGREDFGGGTFTGIVESVDADSVTIRTESGLAVTVGIDGTTTYHQATDAQASDVAVGTTVEVTVAGRARPQGGSNGEVNLGTASDVTIVP
jgi:hypothetical protein